MADIVVTERQHYGGLTFFQFCEDLAEYRQDRFASAADWMSKALSSSAIDVPLRTDLRARSHQRSQGAD
jgi:hypothetical protein